MSSFFYTQSCSNRSLCFKKVQHLRCYQTFSVISIHWDVRSFKVWHLYWFPKDMKTDYQQFLKTLSLLKKKKRALGTSDVAIQTIFILMQRYTVLMGLALQVMSGKAYICTPSKIIATYSTQGCMSTSEPLNSHEWPREDFP